MQRSQYQSETWLRHRLINTLQSLLLLLVMALFLAVLGWLVWGEVGLVITVVVGAVLVLGNPARHPRLVMRAYRAQPISPLHYPVLYKVVEELSHRAQLESVPRLYVIPSTVLNAFSVGSQSNSAVGVSQALLERLPLREITAILGHEISHIAHNDLWIMGVADLFSRLTSFAALCGQILLLVNIPLVLFGEVSISWLMILLLLVAPGLSALAQLALSRTREYLADAEGAWITADPEALARALAKIEKQQGHWMEQLVLPGRHVPVPSLLRTHPATEQRIERLRELAVEVDPADRLPLDEWEEPVFAPAFMRPRRRWNGLWF